MKMTRRGEERWDTSLASATVLCLYYTSGLKMRSKKSHRHVARADDLTDSRPNKGPDPKHKGPTYASSLMSFTQLAMIWSPPSVMILSG